MLNFVNKCDDLNFLTIFRLKTTDVYSHLNLSKDIIEFQKKFLIQLMSICYFRIQEGRKES